MVVGNCLNANQLGIQCSDAAGTWVGRSVVGANAAVTVTNQTGVAGNITIGVVGMGLPSVDVTTATQAMSTNTNYITNRSAGVAYTLPATANLGDIIIVAGKVGTWSIAQAAGQQISAGKVSTTVGVTGTATATDASDCLILQCITSGVNTIWRAISGWGNVNYV